MPVLYAVRSGKPSPAISENGIPAAGHRLTKSRTTRKITGRRKAADGRASAQTHRADDTTAGGTRITHHAPHPFPHGYFAAMNGHFLQTGFLSPNRQQSNRQQHTRAIPDTPDKAPGSLPGGYSKTDHPLDDPLLIVYPPPEKSYVRSYNHQLAANQYPQISNTAPYRNDHYRHTRFPKPPGHLAIPPYQSILYKYNQIVRIFVFYPDAVYPRLRKYPRRITCYFRNGTVTALFRKNGPDRQKNSFILTECSIPDTVQR